MIAMLKSYAVLAAKGAAIGVVALIAVRQTHLLGAGSPVKHTY